MLKFLLYLLPLVGVFPTVKAIDKGKIKPNEPLFYALALYHGSLIGIIFWFIICLIIVNFTTFPI